MADKKIFIIMVKEEEMETITLSDLIREAEEASLEEISESRTVELPKLENTLSEANIGNVLKELGIPAHLKGYRYLKYALEIYEFDMPVTKRLYPQVAESFETTASRVERAIRHAIEVSFDRGDKEFISKIFGYSWDFSKKKPTNSEFLSGVYEFLNK